MADIAPDLWRLIEADLLEAIANDPECARLKELLETGAATYEDAHDYALLIGEHCSLALRRHLIGDNLPDGKLFYNIANKTLKPALQKDSELIADFCERLQNYINQQNGVGLKAQKVPFDADRAKGIIDRVSNTEKIDNVKWILDEPVKVFSQHVVDESVKRNVEFQARTGLNPKVTRTLAVGCCSWCAALAGTYTAREAPRDIYKRHDNCRCRVIYDGGELKAYTGKRGQANTFRR